MAKVGGRTGCQIVSSGGPGVNVTLPDIGRVPDYVLEPIDIAKPLTDAQREGRFHDRLLQLRYEEREMSWSLQRMLFRAKAERQRVARGPKHWHRARARAEEWECFLFSETRTNVALGHLLQELHNLMQSGGPSVRRAAMLAYELAEGRLERELGESARAHEADVERLSQQAREPNPARLERAREHALWRDLAKHCPVTRTNARARWIARKAGCPPRWHTIKDFLRREQKRDEVAE